MSEGNSGVSEGHSGRSEGVFGGRGGKGREGREQKLTFDRWRLAVKGRAVSSLPKDDLELSIERSLRLRLLNSLFVEILILLEHGICL